MTIDAAKIDALVESELQRIKDARIVAHVRLLRVEPKPVLRNWDYGEPGTRYPCWSILAHQASNSGIAYCQSGFGPNYPWGLVALDEDGTIGMDSAWFASLIDAFLESFASTDLPIWRVLRTDPSGTRTAITPEDDWDSTLERIYAMRENEPHMRFDCHHEITLLKPQ